MMSESADGGHVVRATCTFARHISEPAFSNLDDDPLLPISSAIRKGGCVVNWFSFLQADLCSIVDHPHEFYLLMTSFIVLTAKDLSMMLRHDGTVMNKDSS